MRRIDEPVPGIRHDGARHAQQCGPALAQPRSADGSAHRAILDPFADEKRVAYRLAENSLPHLDFQQLIVAWQSTQEFDFEMHERFQQRERWMLSGVEDCVARRVPSPSRP